MDKPQPDPPPPPRRAPASPFAAQLLVATMLAVACLLAVFTWLRSLPPARTTPQPAAPARATAQAPAPATAATPAPATSPPVSPGDPSPAPAPAPATPAAAAQPAPPPPPAAPALAGEPPPQLSGLPPTAELARHQKLLERTLDSSCWGEYRTLLQRGLGAALPGNGNAALASFAALQREPLFRTHFLRHEVIGRFPEDLLRKTAAGTEGRSLLAWWLADIRAMEEALLVFSPDDDLPAALAVLTDIWAADPAGDHAVARNYFSLALAFAVVFDKPVKPQAGDEYSQDSGIGAVARFQWYVQQNERGQLAAAVDRSPATDLVWVVCVPVVTSELDWALRHVNLSRRGWGEAYGMVEYLMERAVDGENPYDEYTFAEILKKGGVCGDRAYFCANTGRASGIPAAILGGETDAGSHAWVAMKNQPDEWDTTIGRIGGVSKGTTTDPQTGRQVTEQEFWLWSEREYRSRDRVLDVHGRLWLAALFDALARPADHAAAVRDAHRIGRRFPVTWQHLHDLIARETAGKDAEPAVVDGWKRFVDELRREFREHPRMTGLADLAEERHVFPHAEVGWVRRELARQRLRVVRDSPEQRDLVADSLKREASLLLQRDPPNALREIAVLYDSALREHGGSVTAFKQMAQDYFDLVRADPAAANKAVRDIELAFLRVVDTGTKEFFRANTEAGVHRMICDFHRQLGNNERATLLEKRIDRLTQRAERGAL